MIPMAPADTHQAKSLVGTTPADLSEQELDSRAVANADADQQEPNCW
jgi:hypothetical protein